MLKFDVHKFPPPYTGRRARTKTNTTPTAPSTSSRPGFTKHEPPNFYLRNENTNLNELLIAAATRICGGEFTVRGGVPSPKYLKYNLNRITSGKCTQCRSIHERDNASCSLEKLKENIYCVKVGCYRFKPSKKCHCFKKAFNIILNGGKWSVAR